MRGIDEYNKDFDTKAKGRLLNNPDKPYLEDFYYFLLADTSYSGSYGYLGCVINFLDACKFDKIEKIKLSDYTKYMATIREKSSSYRIMVYSALKKFSNFLKANGIADDYMQFVKRPKFKESQETKDKREKGYMTIDEVFEFIGNIKNAEKKDKWKSRDLAIATVFLNTGIRCSALHKLDINDINIKKRSIRVFEKGELARVVYISDSTAKNLEDWIKYRNTIVKENECALFVSDRKTRITGRTIYNIIKWYGISIKEKNITPHKTRGTYATLLYDKTGDLFFVQEGMGHANPKTTELYIRGKKEAVAKKAADLMGDIIK